MHDLDELAADLRERLLTEPSGEGELTDRIRALVDREAAVLDAGTRAELAGRIAERAFGLGPLEPLLRDPAVDEVMVSGTSPVWVERYGRLEPTRVRFAHEHELRDAIERILAPLGRRVDEAEPLCDARLPDGSRVNVVIPPLALDGPVLTIRRFRRRGFTPEELVANGTLTRTLLDFLARAVRARASLLVCGGTGSGKTTTLNALSSFIGAEERVVTIEDAAELQLRQPHVVRLEARPPNLEGRGEVTIRRLVRNALRMRPDRIVVGEVRGPEALDMLTAFSTGHDGSLTTIHAGTPTEALRRVETLALMADVGLPHAALREQVADAFDLVVCQARAADGTRRVVEVAEVVRVAGGPAARQFYAWRDGAAHWRAGMSPALMARMAAAPPDGLERHGLGEIASRGLDGAAPAHAPNRAGSTGAPDVAGSAGAPDLAVASPQNLGPESAS
jgi:pilus assembly protein CpaF